MMYCLGIDIICLSLSFSDATKSLDIALYSLRALAFLIGGKSTKNTAGDFRLTTPVSL